MKLKFMGKMQHAIKTSGCSVCGNKRATSQGFTRITHKTVAVPSGLMLTVKMGVPFEINDKDGAYLLGQTYAYNNQIVNEFEVV